MDELIERGHQCAALCSNVALKQMVGVLRRGKGSEETPQLQGSTLPTETSLLVPVAMEHPEACDLHVRGVLQ